ncbi:MAG: excinuclease ABC subunit UvrB [Candidatus Roizmanbacteria bacterium]|nr:excinuclease ABC subunit UvrB [Candidatus Roizmanbacteria bacterium]
MSTLFKLVSDFTPTGDQPQAIVRLTEGVKQKQQDQVLLGVTGSGKTFTMANVIERTNLPTLVISHNKTLAGQLYQEFRDFFPKNAVSYFVSYYDYYQPEAYIPQSNTYIEKEAEINEVIDKLRLKSTSNILTRKDVVVVSSVSCIYNIGKPENYRYYTIELTRGQEYVRSDLYKRLVTLQYSQSQFEFKRGTFRDRGDKLDVFLSYEDVALRILFSGDVIVKMQKIDPLTGKVMEELETFTIYAAKHYLTGGKQWNDVFIRIRKDLEKEVEVLEKSKKMIEADRLKKRVLNDLEMIKEVGYVNGIENYSRYFDGRKPGDPPYSLLDYFSYSYGNEWLLIIDESHMTVPQVRGMYNGDASRKKNLVDYGFRLRAALDNRPLMFDEFLQKKPRTVYVSATPAEWEVDRAKKQIVEQLVRPTGIPDPQIAVRPIEGQVQDLIREIEIRAKKKERVLVTTLTKRTAEDLSSYLADKGIRSQYLHSDIKTLERSDILEQLRRGEYDVLIGVNLLREGIDMPEVTLVAILDADREGFLRSRTAFIQLMGRASRNIFGGIIVYTDKMTTALSQAISEVVRRRTYQLNYNKKHNITPTTIYKPIRTKLVLEDDTDGLRGIVDMGSAYVGTDLDKIAADALTTFDKKKLLRILKRQMKREADNLNFELAARIRDKVKELERVDH